LSPRTIPESATVVVASDVLASELGAEYVLLNLNNGTYYGLQDVGSEIWKMLQNPVTVDAICSALIKTFEVEPERCHRDVMRLLGELLTHGLVEVREAIR
jgi:predicted component of type VI protein secretion system